MKNNSLTNNSK